MERVNERVAGRRERRKRGGLVTTWLSSEDEGYSDLTEERFAPLVYKPFPYIELNLVRIYAARSAESGRCICIECNAFA